VKTYTIKPLEWEGEIKEEFDYMGASTPFGRYGITLTEEGGFTWGYCFDEYYDEGDFPCDSIEEGKRLAEEHWQKRLAGALEEV